MKHGSRGRFFSLIELLITVAIIAILAALLFPALRAARERASSIICIGNLKQQAIGFGMYAADFDNYYPQPMETNTPPSESWFFDDWQNKLAPYVLNHDFRKFSHKTSVFWCNSERIPNPRVETIYLTAFKNPNTDLFRYCANKHLSPNNDGAGPIPLSGVNLPSVAALVMENRCGSPMTESWGWNSYNGCAPHLLKSNALFCDLHAETISYTQVPVSEWTAFWKGKMF